MLILNYFWKIQNSRDAKSKLTENVELHRYFWVIFSKLCLKSINILKLASSESKVFPHKLLLKSVTFLRKKSGWKCYFIKITCQWLYQNMASMEMFSWSFLKFLEGLLIEIPSTAWFYMRSNLEQERNWKLVYYFSLPVCQSQTFVKTLNQKTLQFT